MPDLLIVIAFVWIGLVMGFGAWRRAQSGKPMFPRVPQGAAFGETMCSGRVLRGWTGRLGGATNCLIVFVDHGRFGAKFAFPLNFFPMAGTRGLEFDVPVSAISAIVPGRRFRQDALRIDFSDPNRAPIELIVRDEVGLVAALGLAPTCVNAARPLRNAPKGARLSRRIPRIFMCIWGGVFMIAGGFGIASDLSVRANGELASGTAIHVEDKNTIVQYRVHGVDYTLVSHFNGLWTLGETEPIIFRRDDPTRATEGGMLTFVTFMTFIGLLVFVIGLFGPRLIPGWSYVPA